MYKTEDPIKMGSRQMWVHSTHSKMQRIDKYKIICLIEFSYKPLYVAGKSDDQGSKSDSHTDS